MVTKLKTLPQRGAPQFDVFSLLTNRSLPGLMFSVVLSDLRPAIESTALCLCLFALGRIECKVK
jgi:hypothetical protein